MQLNTRAISTHQTSRRIPHRLHQLGGPTRRNKDPLGPLRRRHFPTDQRRRVGPPRLEVVAIVGAEALVGRHAVGRCMAYCDGLFGIKVSLVVVGAKEATFGRRDVAERRYGVLFLV